ncbi:MAG: phosphatidate cytidylyltransferase [Candidatus Marinimicrobia bacterium]|nr:phosphatidate cytidylyltransferase [Candidatus Neomarinimicrobiota bacterium]
MAIKENKKSRTLVNLIGVPSLLFVMWQGGYWFIGVFTALILLAALELSDLVRQQKGNPLTYLLMAGLIGLISTQLCEGAIDQISILILVGLLSLCVEIFRGEDKPLLNMATVNFGMIWLGLLLGSLISVRLIPEHGFTITVAMFVSVWTCDTFAFIVGSKFGKTKVLPSVSPKKSWEGSIAGLVGAILFMLILFYNGAFGDWLCLTDVIAIGFITGGFSQLGDFAESLLKREAGVKDTSDYLQGHGGILDRFDSLAIAAPLTYLYLQYMNLI